ncbi:MAG: ThiF family adenylyltransferase [Deltaproteobacteria bacterium]|nr:ThiF family adenylyltransferase [Deltaproteobacteria bacterium]
MKTPELTYPRLRPSVAMAPVHQTVDGILCDFFMGNTRVNRRFVIQQDLFECLKLLDGTKNASDVVNSVVGGKGDCDFLHKKLKSLLHVLREKNIVEDVKMAEISEADPRRRVLSFLGDFFPDYRLVEVQGRLQSAVVIICGIGGVGSWVAHFLCRSGVGHLVLIDPDVVQPSNLNRSLFPNKFGEKKVAVLSELLRSIDPHVRVDVQDSKIQGPNDLEKVVEVVLGSSIPPRRIVVVNCADEPNVDFTNDIIGSVCMPRHIPHVVAGGYNLHLGLMGPTVIPFRGPCLECVSMSLKKVSPDGFEEVRKLDRPLRKLGSLGPMVGLVSAFAANEAIRTILNGDRLQPALNGQRMEYDFFTGNIKTTGFERQANCKWCGHHGIYK